MTPLASRSLTLIVTALVVGALVGSAVPVGAQAPPAAQAPPGAPSAPGAPTFKPEEIEQLVAPIALYPDALLAQALMASTYPLDVVAAARFAKANANLKGSALDEALKQQPWDDSVKSLVSFPQVLDMMNEKLDWTQKLGDAVLAQQKEVLDAVQRLRAKAYETGALKTTDQQKVTMAPVPPTPPQQEAAPPAAPAPSTVVVQQPPSVITIEPANPQVVYVPSYNPAAVYGAWPYPAYPPPAPYYPPGYVAGTALLSFGVGMAVGGALWGDCDWGGGHADVNVERYNNYTKNVNRSEVANQKINRAQQQRTAQGGNRSSWQHNPDRRGQVPYRNQATAQQYGRASTDRAAAQSRESFRGRTESPGARAGSFGQGGAGTGAGQRPSTMDRPGGGQRQSGFQQQGAGGRGAGVQQGGRQGGAFEGVGQGRQTSNFSNRGAQSLGSANRSAPSRGAGGGGAARGGGGGGRGGGRR